MTRKAAGAQELPERPATSTDDDGDDADRDPVDGLSGICTTPGVRRTSHLEILVVEAELAADGVALGNPAKPTTEAIGEQLFERLEGHDDELVPAWTRPWTEGGDGE